MAIRVGDAARSPRRSTASAPQASSGVDSGSYPSHLARGPRLDPLDSGTSRALERTFIGVEDITIDAPLALGLLRLLDGLCEGGFLAYYDDGDVDIRAEAAVLRTRLLERVQRPFSPGDRVVPANRSNASPGTVVAQVLFGDGWEVHVDWPDDGVGISRPERLARADANAR